MPHSYEFCLKGTENQPRLIFYGAEVWQIGGDIFVKHQNISGRDETYTIPRDNILYMIETDLTSLDGPPETPTGGGEQKAKG